MKKTWKLYIGGEFVRSESGRYSLSDDGENLPRASRKDARDAVQAALGAQPGWAARSAFNRGQILYRLAEVMEARRVELVARVDAGGGDTAEQQVEASIDRVVSWAGWTDKYASLLASANPVAGPFFGFSVPEPLGVVACAAPERPALLGLVGAICPALASGNAVVVVVSGHDPRSALSLAECLATSDLPGGVVNLLVGSRSEILPHLARHQAVRGLDLWDLDDALGKQLELDAAETVKRVSRRTVPASTWYDARFGSSPGLLERFVETKTVWHPVLV